MWKFAREPSILDTRGRAHGPAIPYVPEADRPLFARTRPFSPWLARTPFERKPQVLSPSTQFWIPCRQRPAVSLFIGAWMGLFFYHTLFFVRCAPNLLLFRTPAYTLGRSCPSRIAFLLSLVKGRKSLDHDTTHFRPFFLATADVVMLCFILALVTTCLLMEAGLS